MAEARDVDEVVADLMAGAEELGREWCGDGAPTYPPGVDPVQWRDIGRAKLHSAIVEARAARAIEQAGS